MNREMLADELDSKIEQFLTSGRVPSNTDSSSLVEIAAELCFLPNQQFKESLKAHLLEQAEASLNRDFECDCQRTFPAAEPELMPTLSQRQYVMLPADPRSFLLSFASHAAVIALIASGIWVAQRAPIRKSSVISQLTYLPLPMGGHGGGSGGDHSPVQASRGTPPKFSEEQLAPPAIVVRNPDPRLQIQPTALGPPQVQLPQSRQLGDLFSSNVVIPSNGTGSGGGMGSDHGTGAGPGTGPGVGLGSDGGFGGGPFRPGKGVTAPRAIYDPDPEYSEEARKARYQGIVELSLIVDATGHARNIRVARALGMGLDEKAIAAVQQWRFTPGMKDGHAVAVLVNVEVNFRLY